MPPRLWLADECVSAAVVLELRRLQFDVLYVATTSPGATDVKVIEQANHEGRLLLTEDSDYGELVFRLNYQVPGIVFLRVPHIDRAAKWARLFESIQQHGDQLMGHYTVVGTRTIRSRPLP